MPVSKTKRKNGKTAKVPKVQVPSQTRRFGREVACMRFKKQLAIERAVGIDPKYAHKQSVNNPDGASHKDWRAKKRNWMIENA